MQALEGHIEMRWERPWFWPFSKMLVSRGDKVQTYIPKANEFAAWEYTMFKRFRPVILHKSTFLHFQSAEMVFDERIYHLC
jgi:hypothetical protein